jgi:hypothetical protein
MGYGNYSHAAHTALIADRAAKPGAEVFTQRSTHPLMNPRGLKMRESRDSADHPNSLGVVFALDVTGSMGDIPQILATRELPNFHETAERLRRARSAAACSWPSATPRPTRRRCRSASSSRPRN